VIDIVPGAESADAERARLEKRAWMQQRGYTVVALGQQDVLDDVSGILDSIAGVLAAR
jgi:very-short-patch-repair endonuclease